MCKIEEDVVFTAKLTFYKRYVHDISTSYFRIWIVTCYHNNTELTLEENPKKFSDTKSIRKNGTINSDVYKITKCRVHWSSTILSICKRNGITDELYRARKCNGL